MVYYQNEPFGAWRDDYRVAILTALMANVYRDQKTRREPYVPEDFMPRFGESDGEQAQTPEEMLMVVEMLNVAFGGRDLR